jgi:hypothetical protein
MKKKLYSLIFISVIFLGNAYAQDTLHVGESLIQKVAGAADGATIVVKSGVHDAQDEAVFIENKSLTIKGEEGDEKPKVFIKQIDVTGTGIDLTFEGLDLTGATLVDSVTGEEDTTVLVADYLINLVEDHVSSDDIIFRDCIVRNFERSVIRGDRSPAHTADSIVIDNCIMHDFRGGGDYGPFRLKKNITINTFIIKNSTMYDFLNKLIDCQDIVTSQLDVIIENCTFYAWGGGKDAQYLFDIQDNETARLYIKSCILGKTNSESVTVRAFRSLEDAYAEIKNTAMAPDFIVDTTGAYDRVPWDVDEFNEVDFDPEFEYPDTGNFNIPAGSELRQMSPTGGPIGDPRWIIFYSGIEDHDISSQIQVYPNPASKLIFIKSEKPGIISIYNILGVKVREVKIQSMSLHTLDISNLTPGLYFMELNNNSIVQKILIR